MPAGSTSGRTHYTFCPAKWMELGDSGERQKLKGRKAGGKRPGCPLISLRSALSVNMVANSSEFPLFISHPHSQTHAHGARQCSPARST